MKTASTLLEVLAAVVLLGLLAAAVVPAQRDAVQALQRSEDVFAAELHLHALLSHGTPPAGEAAIVGHPDWRLTVRPVPALVQATRVQPLPHGWWRCAIERDGAVLAEAMVVRP